MPLRGERIAPQFNSSKPRELGWYFESLEELFECCSGVDTEELKKKKATYYVDVEMSNVFKSLPEYGEAEAGQPANTYEVFKKAALKYYPGADDDRTYMLADLVTLVTSMLATGKYDREALASFDRQFNTRYNYLRSKGKIAEAHGVKVYISAFPTRDQQCLVTCLEVQCPNREVDEHYKLKEVMKAAAYVYSPTSLQPFRAVGVAQPPTPQPSSTSCPRPAGTVKVEALTELLTALLNQVNPQSSAPPPPQGERCPQYQQNNYPRSQYQNDQAPPAAQRPYNPNIPVKGNGPCFFDGCSEYSTNCAGVQYYTERGYICQDVRGESYYRPEPIFPTAP